VYRTAFDSPFPPFDPDSFNTFLTVQQPHRTEGTEEKENKALAGSTEAATLPRESL